MTTTSVKWRGREVQNPVMRKLVIAYALAYGLLTFAWAALVLALMTLFSPVLVLVHFILVWNGRQGFVVRTPTKFTIRVNKAAFRKV